MGKFKIWGGFAAATLLFYFTPLFDSKASVQWDAVDVHYSAQKFFATSLFSGHLPHWTPFVFSGYPFLADPQTAGWYPLHWPFFLIGITPKAIEGELALHAFLALCGTFLLARKLTGDQAQALIAATLYAGGGFFAAHSSHVGMFETAALLPWLLWAALRALEESTLRWILVTGGIGGAIVLIGHFQSTLYSFLALGLFAVVRAPWQQAVRLVITTVVITLALGAVQIIPGLELTAQSERANADYHVATIGNPNAFLKPAALVTMILPNFYGAVSGGYSGPPDITQYYFYAGILLVPLAILGIWKRRSIPALILIVPTLWYAFGPALGLYWLVTFLPGLRSVRAPVHAWFVVALGLALSAAAGAAWLAEHFRAIWIMMAVLLFSAADLWYWNIADNQLAYANASYAEKYGDAYDTFERNVERYKQGPPYRIWSPFDSNAFGPLNSSLEGHTEVTYGYNPLQLARYGEYMKVAEQNHKLLNGLAVTLGIDTQRGGIGANNDALPRIYAPPHVQFVTNRAAALSLLPRLDPLQAAIVEGPLRVLGPGRTPVEILEYRGDYYRAKYAAPFDCLLRIAVPNYPGWKATIDGKPVPVEIVDDALSGVIAPAGNHELIFQFHSRTFGWGATISLLTLSAILLGFFWSSKFASPRR